MGDFDKSLVAFNEGNQIKPDPMAYIYAAMVHKRLGKTDEVDQCIQQAMDLLRKKGSSKVIILSDVLGELFSKK